jgi:hypothetical protein
MKCSSGVFDSVLGRAWRQTAQVLGPILADGYQCFIAMTLQAGPSAEQSFHCSSFSIRAIQVERTVAA